MFFVTILSYVPALTQKLEMRFCYDIAHYGETFASPPWGVT